MSGLREVFVTPAPQPVPQAAVAATSQRSGQSADTLDSLPQAQVEGGAAATSHPSTSSATNQADTLAQRGREIQSCQRCKLHEGRNYVVYGEGSATARLMIIGEGPGAEEDRTGKPFIGRAGQLLTKMLAAIHIDRQDVYIANIVKCRPPGNRDPRREEVEACLPYLREQIELIRPGVILLLGRVAARTLLGIDQSLGAYRKRVHEFAGVPVYVTYHPAALLRTPAWKRAAWEDLQRLEKHYNNL
ncbi:MAG: uracil-DNA glycosylase [Candidatus Cloacimonetes bacterium]|nr:uracil-DNA glycosylase [Candidatus Cloacimonadota bacterium]